MKKAFKSIGFAVLYIYFLAFLLIATPYFNWRYARQHGFGSWLAFGEIIATAKAAIWPYYAVAGFGRGRSSTETRSDQHYTNSKRACDEALRVVIRFGGVTTLPPKEASDVAQLLQAAVTEAELVDDAYLERVHPEFRRRYREEYISSLRALADGVRTGDQVKQISATATYNSFSEWMSVHTKELKFP
jgi:hypothetical protein